MSMIWSWHRSSLQKDLRHRLQRLINSLYCWSPVPLFANSVSLLSSNHLRWACSDHLPCRPYQTRGTWILDPAPRSLPPSTLPEAPHCKDCPDQNPTMVYVEPKHNNRTAEKNQNTSFPWSIGPGMSCSHQSSSFMTEVMWFYHLCCCFRAVSDILGRPSLAAVGGFRWTTPFKSNY